MNVLMVSDVYFPRVNGVSTSIQTFRAALHRAGHRVTLIVPDYGQSMPPEPDVLRVPSRGLWLDPEDRMMRPRALSALARSLPAGQYDLVHIQTPFIAHYAGLRLARRLGVPAVATYHTYFEEYLYHYVPLLPKGLMRFAARRFTRAQTGAVSGLVVPSLAMKSLLQGYGLRTPLRVIPTGIDTASVTGGDGQRFRARCAIAPHRPTLIHVGRVAFEKNIEFLLHVVDRVRHTVADVLLVIAGEGPARAALAASVRTLGLQDHVLFVGYLKRGPDLWDCYRAGDVFVFASTTETQGLVLLEAMALGVPVVSVAVLGTKDILDRGRGALVADLDVEDFSAKVVRVLGDEALRKRLAAEGPVYARQWSPEETAQALVTFYREVIEAGGIQVAPDDALDTGRTDPNA